MQQFVLRDYQQRALDEIRRLYSHGKKRALLQLSTGGGKTLVFSTIMKSAKDRGTRCVMAVRGRALVDQASRRLDEMGVEHSVYMSSDKRYDKDQLIQIASIDTINSRGAPAADLVIIDEAHYATSKSFLTFLDNYPNAFWLSVTATPWVKGTLRHLVSDHTCVVYPITIKELIDQGYLCDGEYWAPSKFDRSVLGVNSTGEFKDDDIVTSFEKQHIYGDVVENFKKRCVGEPSLVFCVNKKHAYKMAESFDEAQISNVVVTAETKLQDRLDYMRQLEDRTLNAIINIGTMTTGVDIPDLRNLVICRPTTSRNLHVQMLGRGTRKPATDKTKFKVFDHVGNVLNHGVVTDEVKVDLAPKEISKHKKKVFIPPVKCCDECYAICAINCKVCPECGEEFEIEKREIVEVKTEMIKIGEDDTALRIKMLAPGIMKYMWSCGNEKSGRLWYLLLDKIPEDKLKKHSKLVWEFKELYDSWLDGSTPAPCPFNFNNLWD